jgi:hypothetical protein
MPTFGFSAFLKLICLNPGPQRTEIRTRLTARDGGYDFHRSLRLRAHRLLVDDEPLDALFESLSEIRRQPERNSARAGLERLHEWRAENPGEVIPFAPATYESSTGAFRVTFTPDFGIRLPRGSTAVHVWNTASPALEARFVYAALSLFSDLFRERDGSPEDLAVLSLREPRLFLLSDVPDHSALARGMVHRLEELFHETEDDLRRRPTSPPDHPAPPLLR